MSPMSKRKSSVSSSNVQGEGGVREVVEEAHKKGFEKEVGTGSLGDTSLNTSKQSFNSIVCPYRE